ncbi:MAG: hypothetical protein AB1403_22235, partial [Candidatus Riflebacteria bacterium]
MDFSGGKIHPYKPGFTDPNANILSLTTDFDGCRCKISNIEFSFEQTVYFAMIGDKIKSYGFLFEQTEIADKSYVDLNYKHENVHAISNIALAAKIFPAVEMALKGKSSSQANSAACKDWANSLASHYKDDFFYNQMLTASNKWHSLVGYGSVRNSYSPEQETAYFLWFNSWLKSMAIP